MKIELVEDWRRAHRWLSVRLMALGVALQSAWPLVPDDVKSHLPSWLFSSLSIGILIAAVAGRLVQQAPKDKP